MTELERLQQLSTEQIAHYAENARERIAHHEEAVQKAQEAFALLADPRILDVVAGLDQEARTTPVLVLHEGVREDRKPIDGQDQPENVLLTIHREQYGGQPQFEFVAQIAIESCPIIAQHNIDRERERLEAAYESEYGLVFSHSLKPEGTRIYCVGTRSLNPEALADSHPTFVHKLLGELQRIQAALPQEQHLSQSV